MLQNLPRYRVEQRLFWLDEYAASSLPSESTFGIYKPASKSYRTHHITSKLSKVWLVETNVICAGPLTAEGLFPATETLSPKEGSDVFWVIRQSLVDTFFGDIAAKSGEHRESLLWAKCFALNANCEKIFVEIWSENLMHTLITGTF